MINGWFDEDEAEALRSLCIKTKGPIVEIGSYQGKSTVVLASFGRPVRCIDTWQDYFGVSGEESYQKFLENTKGLPVIPVRRRVEDWEPVQAELVFCDGDHSYEGTKAQIQKALACHPRFIACHDVSNEPYAEGVRRATEELLGRYTSHINRVGIWEIK